MHSTHMILIHRGSTVGGFVDGVFICVGGVSVYVWSHEELGAKE